MRAGGGERGECGGGGGECGPEGASEVRAVVVAVVRVRAVLRAMVIAYGGYGDCGPEGASR